MARKEEERRLREFAGSSETDAEGRCLDRRGFKETIRALQHLHTCQMGWYRNPDHRYRPDLLQILGNDFTPYGLSKDPGITMHVSADSQSWYAWRRTVTGWCFAIGATGPPPNQWEFDGPEPPDGPLGERTRSGAPDLFRLVLVRTGSKKTIDYLNQPESYALSRANCNRPRNARCRQSVTKPKWLEPPLF